MRLASLRHLTPGAGFFLFQLLALSLVLRLTIRLLGFNRSVALLPAAQARARVPGAAELARYRRMIHWARFFAPVANCLSTALAGWWLLKRRGIVTALRFGAAGGVEFRAHAWLEYDGFPMTYEANPQARYTAFEQPIL